MIRSEDFMTVCEVTLRAVPACIHGEIRFNIYLQASPAALALSIEDVEAAFRDALVKIIEGKK